jgi:hypothetical protein
VEVTDTRRCAWKLDDGVQCPELAKARGKRGPIPRHCEEHTKARKRVINHHPVKPRASRPDCCRDGVCPQHRENAAVKAAWKTEDYNARVNERPENRWFLDLLADGYHVERQLTAADHGPDEGRTRPLVFNADPFSDDDAAGWFTAHHGWAMTGNSYP